MTIQKLMYQKTFKNMSVSDHIEHYNYDRRYMDRIPYVNKDLILDDNKVHTDSKGNPIIEIFLPGSIFDPCPISDLYTNYTIYVYVNDNINQRIKICNISSKPSIVSCNGAAAPGTNLPEKYMIHKKSNNLFNKYSLILKPNSIYKFEWVSNKWIVSYH